MQKYPTYKPSNIDWIGEIPSHWLNRKIAWSFSQIGSGTTPKSDTDVYYENGTINWLLTGDLNDGEITETSKKITELAIKDNSTLKMYPKDSIVIAMYGATIGKLGILKIETTTNQACCVMAKSIFFHYKYVFYWLLSSRESIINLGYGGGQPNINQDLVKSLRATQPPLTEQQSIVAYLDEKTALIDELMAKKESKIALLKEQRAALINQAVTKGLDSTIPMKDSKIEWIGEVPKHWIKTKLKYNGFFISGFSFDSNSFESDGEIRVIKISNVQNDGISWEDLSFVPTDFLTKYKDFEVKKGDLIFVLTRPIISTGIKVCFYNEDFLALLNQRNSIFRPKESVIEKKLLYYLVRSFYFVEEFKLQLKETNQPNISTEQISNINISLPPLSEQQAIVSYLDEQTALIDKTIEIEQQKISTLKEYRQSLISNVVTGKVKVSPVAPDGGAF